MVITWMTKCIQTLPRIHPLKRIKFLVFGALAYEPEVTRICSTLDEALSTPGCQVTLVFNFDYNFSKASIPRQHHFITSAFPLSTKLGLLSFEKDKQW